KLKMRGIIERIRWMKSANELSTKLEGRGNYVKLRNRITRRENYEDKEAAEIIGALLEKYDCGITVGEAENTGYNYSMRFDYLDLLAALDHIKNITGWTWWVDADDKLYFKPIRTSPLLLSPSSFFSIERILRYDEVKTAFYALGAGEGAGQLVAYAEDEEAQGSYGFREGAEVQKNIDSLGTLGFYCNTMLSSLSKAKEELIIDAYLAEGEDAEVGAECIITDESLGIEERSYRVKEVSFSYSERGEAIRMHLGDLAADLNDIMIDIMKKVAVLNAANYSS
ncbi:MAG: hypothetical protein QXJ15_04425, partial [Candidatus Bathyarchaeia archaeon]